MKNKFAADLSTRAEDLSMPHKFFILEGEIYVWPIEWPSGNPHHDDMLEEHFNGEQGWDYVGAAGTYFPIGLDNNDQPYVLIGSDSEYIEDEERDELISACINPFDRYPNNRVKVVEFMDSDDRYYYAGYGEWTTDGEPREEEEEEDNYVWGSSKEGTYKDPIDGMEWDSREEYLAAIEAPEISEYPVDEDGYPYSIGLVSASETLFTHGTHDNLANFLQNEDDPTLGACYIKTPTLLEIYPFGDEYEPEESLRQRLVSVGITDVLYYTPEKKLNPVKIASVLSPVRESLDEKIWDGEKLKSEVSEFCFSVVESFLSNFMELEEIPVHLKRIILIGSITGFQYDDDADLDVNILVDLDTLSDNLGVDKELLIYEMRGQIGKINGEIYPGTSHPCNLFLSTDEGYPPADGIYDMLTDEWIKKPGHPGDIDPYSNLKDAIDRAEQIAEKVDAKWGAAQRTKTEIDRYPLSSPQITRQYIRYLKSLNRILENVVNERRESFDMAKEQDLDPPQAGTPNIVYKYLEFNGLLDTLHEAAKTLKTYEETGSFTNSEIEIIIAADMRNYNDVGNRDTTILISPDGQVFAGDSNSYHYDLLVDAVKENPSYILDPSKYIGWIRVSISNNSFHAFPFSPLEVNRAVIQEDLKETSMMDEIPEEMILTSAAKNSMISILEKLNDDMIFWAEFENTGEIESTVGEAMSHLSSKVSRMAPNGQEAENGSHILITTSKALKMDSRASQEKISGMMNTIQFIINPEGEITDNFINHLDGLQDDATLKGRMPANSGFQAYFDMGYMVGTQESGWELDVVGNTSEDLESLANRIRQWMDQEDYVAISIDFSTDNGEVSFPGNIDEIPANTETIYIANLGNTIEVHEGDYFGTGAEEAMDFEDKEEAYYYVQQTLDYLRASSRDTHKVMYAESTPDDEWLTEWTDITDQFGDSMLASLLQIKEDPFIEEDDPDYGVMMDLPEDFFTSMPRVGVFNKLVALDGNTYWWPGDGNEVHHHMVLNALGLEDDPEPGRMYVGYVNDEGSDSFSVWGEIWIKDIATDEKGIPSYIMEQLENTPFNFKEDDEDEDI